MRRKAQPTVLAGSGENGCPHHHRLRLGYVAWHAEAERRGAAGMTQTQCPDCHLWLWDDEWGLRPSA